MIKQLDKWHRTRLGFVSWSLVELGIAYGFASLSIDRGNLWWYLLTIIFFVGAVQNSFKLMRTFIHGRH
ncbi:MAG TPA: hypothetical protein VNG32_05315 [Candidatus Dormibacteraeota bacterium]|nr:hypothetical protein [Candidatus Dormibacteraeota bacterium]